MKTLLLLIVFFYLLPFIFKKVIAAQRRMPGAQETIRITPNPLRDFFTNFLRTTSSMNTPLSHMRVRSGKVAWLVLGIAALILLVKSITVVPAGYVGVVDIFGNVRDRELSSGIHLVNPLARIITMTVRTEEYTMSVTRGEGRRKGADAIRALTNEGLTVDLDITVFYHLQSEAASDVYRTLGLDYAEKIIRPEIRSAIREVIAQYDAKAVYSDKREEIAQAITDRLRQTITPRGIAVEQVLLRNVTLPADLSQSIQQKLQAEQDSQRYDFVLQKEKKEAERKRIEAAGQRDAQKIINESLTPRYLEYLYIKELKDRKGTIYVPTSPTNGLPTFRGI